MIRVMNAKIIEALITKKYSCGNFWVSRLQPQKENEMILLYTVLGVLSVMFSVLAFGSRKNLLEGGWDEEMIDEVKKFFHTNNFKNNQKSVK